MDTKLTRKCPVSEEKSKEIVAKKINKCIEEQIRILMDEIITLYTTHSRNYLLGTGWYIDMNSRILIPDLETYEAEEIEKVNFENNTWLENKYICNSLPLELPKVTQLIKEKELLQKRYGKDQILCVDDEGKRALAYRVSEERTFASTNKKTKIIPIVNLNYKRSNELLVKYLVPYGLCPDRLTDKRRQCLFVLNTIFMKKGDLLYINQSDGKILFDGGDYLVEEYGEKSNKDWIDSLHCEFVQILKKYYEDKSVEASEMYTKEELLNCEKIRADIDPYEERILTDPNRGHWDLWMDQNDTQYTVELEEDMVARNPLCDINQNGVIAIDFGTKSTIVVYQSDIEHSLPMGIGEGRLEKEPSAKRYENPTVMHFVDLESFLKAYKEKPGRPDTKWENLTISHTAKDQFSNSKSSEYYEYLHQIKQWAGQREKQFRVQDHTGKTYVLPSFMDLKDDEWNPIEIYAYYIGLYINNMRKGHGIFLDYYLSFPVTYETKIREKIIKSFEKGLKKSLPASILKNKEVMEHFHVNGEISEPAAYAVCALQEYGFEPEEDEEVLYGIFDFGGGTTDFDFGLWKQSKKRRYDYTIENFGAGGDEYLGGENLLELIAFEVFKENQELMRKNGYTFTLAPKCTEFLGSDALLADSQEAEKNMHNLMEKIRPYWEKDEANEEQKTIDEINKMSDAINQAILRHPEAEKIKTELEKIRKDTESRKNKIALKARLNAVIANYKIDIEEEDDQITFVVTLFDKDGNDHPNERLEFSRKKLNQIIERRISEGVNNFFSALMLSYQNGKAKKAPTVNILLAGNSCKSPVVKEAFQKAIAEREREIKEKYKKDENEKMFEIFPPLGTEEAYKKMESRGIKPERGNYEKPTGKTGVAFGLLQCRAGGTIERITNTGIKDEIPFQYFIGWRSRKKFVLFSDDTKLTKYKGKPDYNEWYKFIEADDSVFDLYYTTLPECVEGDLVVDGNAAVKRLRCETDIVDEDACVYIRAIDPHTLEYVVAKDDDVENSKLGKIMRKEL